MREDDLLGDYKRERYLTKGFSLCYIEEGEKG